MTTQSGGTPDPSWIAVDRYVSDLLIPPDPVLDATLAASIAAGLPAINVSPTQGRMLHILARIRGAQRILEIGTLGGYSAIWLARALPLGGQLVTLEADPKHAAVARANFARAGLTGSIELLLAPAIDSLEKMVVAGVAPFDFIFIDADKPSYSDYLSRSLKLSRPGTMIVADNVVRAGKVADATSGDANVQGIRRFNQVLAAQKQLIATTIQTVGSKGYDGFTLAVVGDPGK